MFGAILKATNSSFQKGMTFCRSIYAKKVMKLLAFIFEQPSYQHKYCMVYTQMYLVLFSSSINVYLVCLIHLIVTFDNYNLKKSMYHLSQLQSSILLLNTFLLDHVVKCLLSYYPLQKF